MKQYFSALVALAFCTAVCAQPSRNFEIGKWIEIQNSLLRELNRSYVDSLPLDRMERAGVDAMLASLDPYTVYVPEEENENLEMLIHKSYGGIGAVIYKPDVNGNVIINEPYANSAASKYNLRCGDEIMEIDGKTVVGLTSAQCSEKMRGEPGTKVLFKVKKLRGGIEDIEVIREKIKLPDVEFAGMLNSTVGYISQTGFTEGVGNEVRKAVASLKKQGMKTLVLDLRGNGGGLMNEAAEIVSVFVPKGSLVVSARGRDSKKADYSLYTQKEPVDDKMPLIVLVDSGSASASEIVAGALQDMDRATIMGNRTFGKGLVQSIRSLPYGGELKITTAKYYTPSGRCVQAIDYSNRNEDGSVGFIPDSLTNEFKTMHGRTVRDGGGISPDVTLDPKEYSRLTYAVVTYGLPDQYSLEYVRAHETIPQPEDFHLSDEDYEAFVEWAGAVNFDYRSSAKTLYDQMCKEIAKEGLENETKASLDALKNALEMDKKAFLRLKKDEIMPFLEEEIAIRYWFQEAGVKIRMRSDEVLWKALESPLIARY